MALAKFNLVDGDVSVAINGLSKDEGWDVWMVDSAAGRSIALENDDNMLRLGSFKHEGKVATLTLTSARTLFKTFNMDLDHCHEGRQKPNRRPHADRNNVALPSRLSQ